MAEPAAAGSKKSDIDTQHFDWEDPLHLGGQLSE